MMRLFQIIIYLLIFLSPTFAKETKEWNSNAGSGLRLVLYDLTFGDNHKNADLIDKDGNVVVSFTTKKGEVIAHNYSFKSGINCGYFVSDEVLGGDVLIVYKLNAEGRRSSVVDAVVLKQKKSTVTFEFISKENLSKMDALFE